MSTRKIREALEALPFHAGDSKEACDLADAALAEVEAIERAAKAYAREDSSSLDDDVIAALRVMDSIARDAP